MTRTAAVVVAVAAPFERRNAAMSQWLEEVEREYRSKTIYGEGFEA